MYIQVTKRHGGVELLRKAASFTTNRDCKMSLARAYRNRHSIIRTQEFIIELKDIPLFVASQLVRSHVGIQCFQRSKRIDRAGEDFGLMCDIISRTAMDGYHAVLQGKKGAAQSYVLRVAEDVDSLPKRFDRYAPTDILIIANAEALMNMAAKRLCSKASPETRDIVRAICDRVKECDPDLYPHLVRPCVAAGICRESKPCGYMQSPNYTAERKHYKELFI